MSVLNECWVVSDGKPGMQNQCLGLAEAVGLPVVVKRISVRWPWTWLLPQMWPSPLAWSSSSGVPSESLAATRAPPGATRTAW